MLYQDVLNELNQLKDPEKIIYKEKKFGITSNNSLGIYHADLKVLAKKIGQDNGLAIDLFNSGIYEARILCSKIFRPQDITELLMEQWVATFENWEICDSFCMSLFAKSEFAVAKAKEWSTRDRIFEKRAGFVIMAAYCMADKEADNTTFEEFLKIAKNESEDDRLYVKKSISWTLRNIGKRNQDLRKKAISAAKDLITFESPSSRWIANDTLRELEQSNVRMSDYPRKIYRLNNLKTNTS